MSRRLGNVLRTLIEHPFNCGDILSRIATEMLGTRMRVGYVTCEKPDHEDLAIFVVTGSQNIAMLEEFVEQKLEH